MDLLSNGQDLLYWMSESFSANLNDTADILIALFLGIFVGYERSYNGRAAGMRTYGLVCMSSCALVVIGDHPGLWYGGMPVDAMRYIDPSRIVQGITTGIGFLGAGVIMRDGLNISGLTTAASIWTVATIGVLVGVGFYGTAISLSLISTFFMLFGGKIEAFLPIKHAVSVTLHFHKDAGLTETDISHLMHSQGYEVAKGSFSINRRNDEFEWRFVAVSHRKRREATLVKLSECLRQAEGIQEFNLSRARN